MISDYTRRAARGPETAVQYRRAYRDIERYAGMVLGWHGDVLRRRWLELDTLDSIGDDHRRSRERVRAISLAHGRRIAAGFAVGDSEVSAFLAPVLEIHEYMAGARHERRLVETEGPAQRVLVRRLVATPPGTWPLFTIVTEFVEIPPESHLETIETAPARRVRHVTVTEHGAFFIPSDHPTAPTSF